MEIRLFGTKLCPGCNVAVRRINEAVQGCDNGEVEVNYYDMETVDGLAEGALNEVMKLPTIILADNGNLIARWNGEVPDEENLAEYLKKSINY